MSSSAYCVLSQLSVSLKELKERPRDGLMTSMGAAPQDQDLLNFFKIMNFFNIFNMSWPRDALLISECHIPYLMSHT